MMNKTGKIIALSLLLSGMINFEMQARSTQDHVIDVLLLAGASVGCYYGYKWMYPAKKQEVASQEQDEAAAHADLLKRSTEKREQQEQLVTSSLQAIVPTVDVEQNDEEIERLEKSAHDATIKIIEDAVAKSQQMTREHKANLQQGLKAAEAEQLNEWIAADKAYFNDECRQERRERAHTNTLREIRKHNLDENL